MKFAHITADMPIIGFTGALGSGCTYMAKGLADHHNYAYCSLSRPIHEHLAKKGMEPTSKNLQDTGNVLRAERGLDWLVAETLAEVDRGLGEQRDSHPAGLVVDGLRNTAEVNALRAWPHFYLMSVQANQDLR